MQAEFDRVIGYIYAFSKALRKLKSSRSRWRMQNKNGQNTKERKRNQTMLRGRRCRIHKGKWPTRGKGTTSRSR
jgi:hypothetical protein